MRVVEPARKLLTHLFYQVIVGLNRRKIRLNCSPQVLWETADLRDNDLGIFS